MKTSMHTSFPTLNVSTRDVRRCVRGTLTRVSPLLGEDATGAHALRFLIYLIFYPAPSLLGVYTKDFMSWHRDEHSWILCAMQPQTFTHWNPMVLKTDCRLPVSAAFGCLIYKFTRNLPSFSPRKQTIEKLDHSGAGQNVIKKSRNYDALYSSPGSRNVFCLLEQITQLSLSEHVTALSCWGQGRVMEWVTQSPQPLWWHQLFFCISQSHPVTSSSPPHHSPLDSHPQLLPLREWALCFLHSPPPIVHSVDFSQGDLPLT